VAADDRRSDLSPGARRTSWLGSPRRRIVAAAAIGSLLAAAVTIALYQFAQHRSEVPIQQWVEQQNHVFLVPARSGLLPGDVIQVSTPQPGFSDRSGLQVYAQSDQVMGARDAELLTSEPYSVKVTGSLDAAVQAGILPSRSAFIATASGAEQFELELVDVVMVEAPTSALEEAIASNSALSHALQTRKDLRIVYSVLRPSAFRYRFLGSGGADVTAKVKSAGQPGNHFSAGLVLTSDRPMVIGYALARNLNYNATGPNAGTRLAQLGFEAARETQDDADARLWPPGYKLRISFLNGTEGEKLAFREALGDWLTGANLTATYVSGPADIRVSFSGEEPYDFSYVGRDALRVPADDPTIVFGARPLHPTALRHEIGHALGLVHETSNPAAEALLDVKAITTDGHAVALLHPADYPGRRPFDRSSVMTYALPGKFFTDRRPTTPGSTLSQSDRQYIAALYAPRS
jgi:hypothetical protein